jgi:hypothetical protein
MDVVDQGRLLALKWKQKKAIQPRKWETKKRKARM